MAGYSGTPLPQKLGIKPGHRVALIGAPTGFATAGTGSLPEGVTLAEVPADALAVADAGRSRGRSKAAAPAAKASTKASRPAPPKSARVARAATADSATADFDAATFDVILYFTTVEADLARHFAALARRLEQNGGLWVAWPKRASGVVTDVSEASVRRVALAAGLVDNKVCAIDDIWSGLRCVIRLENRRPVR